MQCRLESLSAKSCSKVLLAKKSPQTETWLQDFKVNSILVRTNGWSCAIAWSLDNTTRAVKATLPRLSDLQAVKCFGTNFELLAKLFPGRCRRMLANKWRREVKVNPERCDEALEGGGGSEGYQRIVDALQEGEVWQNAEPPHPCLSTGP